jgi:glycine reductase
MRLEIGYVDIRDVKVGPETHIINHTLCINFEELIEIILKDDRIKDVELNLVYPGDRIRIVNVVDVIQPRCKIDVEDEDFPGWLGKVKIAGTGRTRSLNGVAVILSNSFSKRPYSALIDMYGVGSEMSKYASMKNVSVHPIPKENLDERDFESAVKIAGLKTAVYLAQAAISITVDYSEIFELDISNLLYGTRSDLPKVAYYYQLHTPQHDYQGIGDPILYGQEVTQLLPTLIHPNEILDGAVVNTHTIRGMDTYSIQNHGIIQELFRRHSRELLFAGVVIGVASVDPVQRERVAMMGANLLSNILGVDGVLISKPHGGMPSVDVGLLGEKCEKLGIKTTIFYQMWHSYGSLSGQVLFNTEKVNALVNIGQTFEKIHLYKADKIIGGSSETRIFHPEQIQTAGADLIEIEGYLQAGVYDHTGGAKIAVSSY